MLPVGVDVLGPRSDKALGDEAPPLSVSDNRAALPADRFLGAVVDMSEGEWLGAVWKKSQGRK